VSVLGAAGAKQLLVAAAQRRTHPDDRETPTTSSSVLRGYAPTRGAGLPGGRTRADRFFLETASRSGDAFFAYLRIDADEHELASLARLERVSAGPTSIERLLRWITVSDVRDLLPRVRAPALVFGITTPLVSAEVTAAMVAGLADVRFVDVGHDPVASGEGLDELMAEIAEFVTGSRAAGDRSSAPCCTDIVGSAGRPRLSGTTVA
jgi:hypothetical protein